MEKHTSKKLLAGILALSAGFVLASCDPISTTTKNYNDPIVLNGDGQKVDLKDNLIGKIYDAIATDRNTKIVSDILDEVAIKKFGSYHDIIAANADDTAKKAYIDAHADVFKRDGDIEGEQINRFDIFYEDIMNRISEVFYNEITSGSYNDDEGRFDEGKLWMAHYYEFYDIDGKAAAEANKFFVTNELTKENAFSEYIKGTYDNAAEGKRGYIEEKVFPQILKDKLVEEYVFNTNYNSLGRSYARKVNYIKVSYEDHVIPWKLLKSFAKLNIEVDGKVNEDGMIDFEVITKAIKGFEGVGDFEDGDHGIIKLTNADSVALLKDTLGDISSVVDDTATAIVLADPIKYGEATLVPAGNYYKNTKLGELLVSYKKALKAEAAGRFATNTDKTELDKFTSNDKPKEYNLREKLISLAKEDYTTDGWFVKNGGLSELPSVLRDRLFNINVANHLDDGSIVKETTSNMGAYEYESDGVTIAKRVPYMRNIFGKNLVIPAKSQAFAENPYNYIYQDVEGKAFYMVQVLEAPSTPKLNEESETSYAKVDTEHPFRTEELARQVAKVLGTKDNYIKDAYTEYLKNYTFTFYETSLYEHFKAEYPDLFDEE